MCEFRIGQKVVCVDASTLEKYGPWLDGEAPTEGAIYTVTGIVAERDRLLTPPEYISCLFAEIKRCAPNRIGYAHWRFRPLITDDSKYDISVFLRICSDVSKGKSRVTVEGVRS